MKFVYGKKQQVDGVELDQLFTELQAALQKHPLVPAANIEALVSEWINDILFVAGKITEEELQEALQSFEKVETSEKVAATAGEEEEDSDKDNDEE
ncbi:MAG: hypothetical protein ABSA50_06660 [Candidatus Bathyarchaeia archaeon]